MDLCEVAVSVRSQGNHEVTHFAANSKFREQKSLAFETTLPQRYLKVYIEITYHLSWRHHCLSNHSLLLVLKETVCDLKKKDLVRLSLGRVTQLSD